MQIITAHSDDFLWKFYTKAFTLADRSIAPPKNLCRYVQTAIIGFGLWLRLEVRLLYLWLAFLVTVVLFAAVLLVDHVLPSHWIIGVIALPVVLVTPATLTVAIFVSLMRLKDWLMERAPWVIGLAMFPVIGAGVYLVVQQIIEEGVPPDVYWMLTVIKWMVYVMLSVLALNLVAALIFKRLPERYLDKLIAAFEKLEPGVDRLSGYAQKIHRLIVTFGHFGAAKKLQVCPLVNPPVDFNAEPKA